MPKVTIGGSIINLDTTPSIDAKYGPYTSVEEAFEYLYDREYNIVGLTVGILQTDGSIIEYWFKEAANAVTDLVIKNIGDAPADNKEYLRRNGTWVENTPGVTEFDALANRPKYNGETITSATNIVVPVIEDSVFSDDSTKVLSARQGKVLQDEISALQQRGRYLSTWNAVTGLAMTSPNTLPYTYRAGDYFIVAIVGDINYKPAGTEYTGEPSTVIEDKKLSVNDTYYYDGTVWSLLHVESSTATVWVVDPAVPTEPTWNSKLAPVAAVWNSTSSAIIDWVTE